MDSIVNKEYSPAEIFKQHLLQDEEVFGNEALAAYIKKFMRSVRSGSQTHLNSIPVLLKLVDKLPASFEPKSLKANVKNQSEEAVWTDVPSDL